MNVVEHREAPGRIASMGLISWQTSWVLHLAVGALVASLGCSKSHVTCGAGTDLKNGVCVVASASPATSLPASPIAAPEECVESCKRVAKCRGLNADAPLIATRCSDECSSMEKGDKPTLRDLIACREKEPCESVDTCDSAYERIVATSVRDSAPDDPVVVAKSSVADARFSKDLTIAYRNKSSKAVDGIKFRYYCSNNFGDPLGGGTLIDQDTTVAAASNSGTWTTYISTCTKVKVIVTDVHFSDGQTWVP